MSFPPYCHLINWGSTGSNVNIKMESKWAENVSLNFKISNSRQPIKDDHSVEELAVVPTHPVRGGQDHNTVAGPFLVANSNVERFPDTFDLERCEASEHSTREVENR